MIKPKIRAAAVLAAAALTAVPATAAADAKLLSVDASLDKTTFQGFTVGGLSALARTSGNQALALTDNQGSTPARFFTLKLKGASAQTTKVTTLKRPDGTPFTGQDFDGEGLVVEPDGTLLISSETEPVIRRFDKQGEQLAQLSTPPRFGVAPNGQAATNQTFEALTATPDHKVLFAGMEGALSADGPTRNRIIRYDKPKKGDFIPGKQFAYRTEANAGLVELFAIDDERLLSMERTFVNNVWGIKVYEVYLGAAQDVSTVAALTDASPFVYKRLLIDVAKHTPLLDNIEGMSLDGDILTLISDDNFNAAQKTHVYRFQVKLHEEPALEGRALYSATAYQPGPPSGTSGGSARSSARTCSTRTRRARCWTPRSRSRARSPRRARTCSPASSRRSRAAVGGRPSRRARTAARCTRSSRAPGSTIPTSCAGTSTSSTSRASATPAASGR